MRLMVSDVLKKKGKEIWSVAPDQSVYNALEMMRSKNIGAVLVMEGDKLVGIFSERDYARKGILEGRASRDTTISEIMTQEVCFVPPWQTIDDCMELMTRKHLRHLPVMEHDQVIGLLSIGDVVKAIIGEQEDNFHELEMYVDDVLKNRNTAEPN